MTTFMRRGTSNERFLPASNLSYLAAEVSRAIAATGRFSNGQLNVSAAGDIITLRGRVTSFYQKQIAQATALAIVGPGHVRNEVEVP